MGKVVSILSRKANRFNVENRAHRILDKEKPAVAPQYEATLEDLKRAKEVDPDYIERESRRDPQLDDRLKQVYVTSTDSFIDYGLRRKDAPDKPLPADRTTVDDYEYGFMEPKTVSRGRCTLRQAMKFITDNQGDPDNWTSERIAEEYQLKQEVVGKILTHFRSFQVYIPDINKKQSVLTRAKQELIGKSDENNKT